MMLNWRVRRRRDPHAGLQARTATVHGESAPAGRWRPACLSLIVIMPRSGGQDLDGALLEHDASRQVSPERAGARSLQLAPAGTHDGEVSPAPVPYQDYSMDSGHLSIGGHLSDRTGRGSSPRFTATPSGVLDALRASRRESGDRELFSVVAASGVQFLEHPELPCALAMLQRSCCRRAYSMTGVVRAVARLVYIVVSAAPAILWASAAWHNVNGCDSDSQFEYLDHPNQYEIQTSPPWWNVSTGKKLRCMIDVNGSHTCGKVPLADFGDALADLGVAGISLAIWCSSRGLTEAMKPGGTLDKLIQPTQLGPLKITEDERRSLKRWNMYLVTAALIAAVLELVMFSGFEYFDPGFDSPRTWTIAIALLCFQTTVVVLWCLAMRFAVTLASAVIIGIRVELARSHGDDFTAEEWKLCVHVRDRMPLHIILFTLFASLTTTERLCVPNLRRILRFN